MSDAVHPTITSNIIIVLKSQKVIERAHHVVSYATTCIPALSAVYFNPGRQDVRQYRSITSVNVQKLTVISILQLYGGHLLACSTIFSQLGLWFLIDPDFNLRQTSIVGRKVPRT
jgi:hypothetical protein